MNNKEKIPSSYDIYTSVKNAIVNLEYPPGMLLSENELAKKFNVSRTPVKSVFTRLENEGFLTVIPQRGTYVTMLDKQKIIDFIYMRLVLEVDMVDSFIQQLDNQDIIVLENLINEQKEKIFSKDFVSIDFFKEDVKFHGYMFQKLGKIGIWKEIQKMQVNYTRYRILDISKSEKFSSLIQEHIELYQAIINKDIVKYKEVLTNHVQGNFEQTVNDKSLEYFN